MKCRSKCTVRFSVLAATLFCVVALPPARATTPQYQIFDIGVVQVGDEASQGFGVSPAGIAVGRSLSNTGSQAFTWTVNGCLRGYRTWPGGVTAYLPARTIMALW